MSCDCCGHRVLRPASTVVYDDDDYDDTLSLVFTFECYIFYVVDNGASCCKMNDFDFSPSFFFSRAVDYDAEEEEAVKDDDWCDLFS